MLDKSRNARLFLPALIALAASVATQPAGASVRKGLERWKAAEYEKAVDEFAGPASRGDVEALFYLGQAYSLGRGVEANRVQAADYYRRAADKGHVASLTNLGIIQYQNGRKGEAMNLWRQAANKGDARAAYVLGVAIFGGDGVPRNKPLGYGYILRARDIGMDLAGHQAGRMATMMTEDERAKGNAVAAALSSGKSESSALAEAALPRTIETAANTYPVQENAPAPAATSNMPVTVANTGADAPVRQQESAKPSTPNKPAPETAKAAPQPAPKPAQQSKPNAQPAEAAQSEGWKVQLGAYANQGSARTAWASLLSQSADLLKKQSPIYSTRNNLVRLQVGPFTQRQEAAVLCDALSAAGRPCFVTR